MRSESSAEQRPYLWRWCVITALVVQVRSRYPVFKEGGWKENSSKANQAERWHHQWSISQQLYSPDERDSAALSFNRLISWPLTLTPSQHVTLECYLLVMTVKPSPPPPPSRSLWILSNNSHFWIFPVISEIPTMQHGRKWAAFQWCLRRPWCVVSKIEPLPDEHAQRPTHHQKILSEYLIVT